DVRNVEAASLHARHDFRKRRDVATRKYVLVDPRTSGSGPTRSIDRVKDADAVFLEELAAFGEELVEVPKPDVLEHADRHDAVEASVETAIVDQAEVDAIGSSALPCPLVRELVLFLRQRHAYDPRIAGFGKIEAEPAPARTDVENLHAGRDGEL